MSQSKEKGFCTNNSKIGTKINVSIAITTKLQPQKTHQTITNPKYIPPSLRSKLSSQIYSSKRCSKNGNEASSRSDMTPETSYSALSASKSILNADKLSLGGNDNTDENINGNALVLPTLQLYSMVVKVNQLSCAKNDETVNTNDQFTDPNETSQSTYPNTPISAPKTISNDNNNIDDEDENNYKKCGNLSNIKTYQNNKLYKEHSNPTLSSTPNDKDTTTDSPADTSIDPPNKVIMFMRLCEKK